METSSTELYIQVTLSQRGFSSLFEHRFPAQFINKLPMWFKEKKPLRPRWLPHTCNQLVSTIYMTVCALEKLSLNFSNSWFVIGVNLLHPSLSLFLYGSLLSLLIGVFLCYYTTIFSFLQFKVNSVRAPWAQLAAVDECQHHIKHSLRNTFIQEQLHKTLSNCDS